MDDLSKTESQNRRKGFIFSVVFHTLLIILAALYGFTYQNPPPEAGGVQVNLGIPDVGQGDENAPKGDPAPPEESKPEPEETTPPPEEKPVKKVEKPKPEPTPKKEVVKTEDPDAIALKKKKEEEKKKQQEEVRQQQLEEKKRKEAQAQAQAEQKRKEAEAQALKDKIAGGLSGSGKGKGNTGKPGNQGDPNGDPNNKNLEGISTGSGVVGGGLGNRGVVKKGPAIRDNSQEEGTVYLDVCVDSEGNVISAEYTLKGSSTNSENLKRLAVRNAKDWKFSKGNVDKQCGTIRYDFKLK